jgi:hypothetical protein
VFRHIPIWGAVRAGDVEMVQFLIGNGADVNLRILVNDIERSSLLEEMLASDCVELRDIGVSINIGESLAPVGAALGDE